LIQKRLSRRGHLFLNNVEIILTGDDIAQVEVGRFTQTGDFYIFVTLTAEGTQKLAEYTKVNIGRYLVIAFDGRVISAPVIQSAISDGKASITGDFDHKSARSLVAQLKSGRLPFKLVVVAIE
jgi:preprotein translocase subunit SecD